MAGNHKKHNGQWKAAGKNSRHNHAQKPEQKAANGNGRKNGREKAEKAGVASGGHRAKISAAGDSGRKKASAANGGERKANGSSARRAPGGTLFAIGGAEDRRGTKVILSYLAERIGSGKLVISTLASEYGDEVWEVYRKLFNS